MFHTIWYDVCCDDVIFNSALCLLSVLGDTNNHGIWTDVVHIHLWGMLKDRVHSSISHTEYNQKESIQNIMF